MKAALKEISDQLHLCAAFMSDPHIIRFQPHVIAAQFVSAARRIEQLQGFLVKPAKAAYDRPWFDKSILDGVNRLVNATLNRHLLPLGKGFKFPKIFEKELFVEGRNAVDGKKDNENMVEREIKETNCMGALVLLYYYLHWHLMLILLNRRYHPAHFDSKQAEDDDEDVFDLKTGFLDKLPQVKDLLDYRLLGDSSGGTKRSAAVLDSDTGKNTMVGMKETDADANANVRKTHSIKLLRTVLQDVFKKDDETEADQKNREKKSSSLLHAVLAHSIERKTRLSGHVLSSFDLQDDISKWEDMYVKFQVLSSSDKINEKSSVVYSTCPVRLFKANPYFGTPEEFSSIAREAAIYDYGSVPLMIDISKSLIRLSELTKLLAKEHTHDDSLHKHLGLFVVQAYEYNNLVVQTALKAEEVAFAQSDDSPLHNVKFIQHAMGQYRAVCDISGVDFANRFTVDNLASVYWGGRPSDLDSLNHHYFACPSLKIDTQTESSLLPRLQKLSSDGTILDNIVHHFIGLHRNSLFVKNIAEALISFTSEFKRTGMSFALSYDTNDGYVPRYVNDSECFHGDTKMFEGPAIQMNNDAAQAENAPHQTHLPLKTIRKNLKLELEALQHYTSQIRAGEFNKYPAVSWPVKYGDEQNPNKTNHDQFHRIRVLPSVTPPLNESAHNIARTLNVISTGMQADRDAGRGGGGGRGAGGGRAGAGGGGAPAGQPAGQ